MAAWLNSPGHRANIENASFRAIGIGVVVTSSGTYWTQNFGTLADGSSSGGGGTTVAKPTVTFTQRPKSRKSQATAAWTATGSPTSVTCTLDGAPVTPCTSPLTLGVLGRRSSHTFTVTAKNSAGSGSARVTWIGVAA